MSDIKPKLPNLPDRAPDCLQCKHFKVTWEPAFPRSCLVFGIKSRNLPSMEVFLSAGRHCFCFEKKEGLK
ncbi:MAG: hypothetical protein LBF78_15555 [Treponema sp.]|nr:hypothetical protein [Treponema sp.]